MTDVLTAILARLLLAAFERTHEAGLRLTARYFLSSWGQPPSCV